MRQEVKGVDKDGLFPFIVADNWYSPEEEKLIWKELDFYYQPKKMNTMISYYDNSQEYKPHFDTVQFTSIIWFYKEPKKFVGGDFIFTQPNQTIECKHNRMIFFPSYYMHSVTPVSIAPENRDKGLGRFAITNFFLSPY